MQIKDGVWLIEAEFPDAYESRCPRCSAAQSRRFGWRKGKFNDQPTMDGRAVSLIARRPRMKCVECGKTYLVDHPYLLNYARITLGMQRHLAREILNFESIRELAVANRLSAKTVMAALKAAITNTQLNQEPLDTLAVRSFAIRAQTYWLGIDPRTLKTEILIEGREQSALKNLVARIAIFAPNEIDLPIDPELAKLLKAALPNAKLTISIPEISKRTQDILQECLRRFSYKLRDEGLNSEQAQNLCSSTSDSLPPVEQSLLEQYSTKMPFWGTYRFRDHFLSQLKAGNVSYRHAIQQAMAQSIDVVRPLILPTYQQLVLLDQLGIETRYDEDCEQIELKLKRLKERLRKQGARFEFPLLSAVIGLFFVHFAGPNLIKAVKQTLIEVVDIFQVPSSYWLSDVERRAILLA